MHPSELQSFNQALLKLLTLIYQCDQRIRLSEQDFVDDIAEGMEWHSRTPIDMYRAEAVIKARQALDSDNIKPFLIELKADLQADPALAMQLARQMVDVDGELNHNEEEILTLLEEKILVATV